MTISQYIHSKEEFKPFNFVVVYCIITELLKDDKIKWNYDKEDLENV